MGPEDAAWLGVPLTNLDESLFEGAGATKRDLITYLDSVADRVIPELADRALSVIRVHRGQEAFMQKNLPSYTPPWVERVTMWADAALVREPARGRVSPGVGTSRQPRSHDASRARHRSPAGQRFYRGCASCAGGTASSY